MVSARIAFGIRSFHATANPTRGGIVSTGPYKYLRHPIYSAVIYFMAAGVVAHFSLRAFAAFALIVAGAVVRMVAEERMLVQRYPEYREYMRRTARIIPFVL
jgi:protein-S-isoprenylcysteine O-methyltransferase Ste14